jgi:hypothetical protein
MERVTWGGIALHAGDLPGYPDSHGCVRLPLEFSKLLFGVTMKGATVIIANAHSAPATTVHPGLFFAQSGQESEPIAAGQFDWDPDKSPTGPVSVIVSSADKTVYVYRNGVEIGRAGIPNPQVTLPLNDLVFSALQGTDADGHLQWAEVTSTGESKSSENIFLASQKSGLPAAFLDKARQSLLRARRLCLLTDLWIRLRRALPIFKFSSRKKTSLPAEPNETRYHRGRLKRIPGFLKAVRVS